MTRFALLPGFDPSAIAELKTAPPPKPPKTPNISLEPAETCGKPGMRPPPNIGPMPPKLCSPPPKPAAPPESLGGVPRMLGGAPMSGKPQSPADYSRILGVLGGLGAPPALESMPGEIANEVAFMAIERAAIIAESEHGDPRAPVPHTLPPSWSESSISPTAGARCWCCSGASWWRRDGSPGWCCSTCHPAPPGALVHEVRT